MSGDRRGLASPAQRVRLLVAVACLTLLALVTASHAQITEPPDTSNPPRSTTDDLQDTPRENQETVPDTNHTPHTKTIAEAPPEDRWSQIAGARFPESTSDDPAKLVADSATTYADNLYDAAFFGTDLGLAGGATCSEPNPDAESGCRPTAFLFTRTIEEGAVWRRMALPNQGDRPGFIAAISWLDPTTAMAVGGTGTFPRREIPYGSRDEDGELCDPPTRDTKPWAWNCDQAGEARAWLYRHGVGWCELGHDQDCPALPRDRDGAIAHGLTAVDFRQYDDGRIVGLVGGLGQVWSWEQPPDRVGAWVDYFDNASPPSEVKQQTVASATGPGELAASRVFRFRVREIRFGPGERTVAYAVTSGCCSAADTTDRPLMITYSDSDRFGFPIPPRLVVEQARLGASPGGWVGLSPELDPNALADAANNAAGTDAVPSAGTTPIHQSGAGFPDSLYSLVISPSGDRGGFLASAASRDSALESGSAIYPCVGLDKGGTRAPGTLHPVALVDSQGRTAPPLSPALSAARLVSSDGAGPNLGGENHMVPGTSALPAGENPCAPDWAAGELRTHAVSERGRRGLLVATKTKGRNAPAANIDPIPQASDVAGGSYEATNETQLRRHLETHEYLTTSYTLNSVELSGAGEGWAVGDHGAILRLGADGGGRLADVRAEPAPPRLGSRAPAELEDPSRFGAASHADRPGEVPSRAQRLTTRLAEPRLVNEGSPDAGHNPEIVNRTVETEDVAQIAMSRDGTEGWAVGANADQVPAGSPENESSEGTLSLHHYDGATWTRCDPTGIKHQLAADPACRSLAPLRRWIDPSKTPRTTRLNAIARVPLENDSIPTNDDEFEVVAIGTSYGAEPAILRYRGGRWDFEGPEARAEVASDAATGGIHDPLRLRDVFFTAPDDGWILARDRLSGGTGNTAGYQANAVFHYGGADVGWERCELDPPEGAAAAFTPGSDCGSEQIPEAQSEASLRLTGAGERVYLFGARRTAGTGAAGAAVLGIAAPLILHHDRNAADWSSADGGLDPGFDDQQPELTAGAGGVRSLAVAQTPDGEYTGWGVGRFFRNVPGPDVEYGGPQSGGRVVRPSAVLLRLEPGGGWDLSDDPGALEDYLLPQAQPLAGRMQTEPHQQITFIGAGGQAQAFMGQWEWGRLFGFDDARERWEIVPTDRPPAYQNATTAEPRPLGIIQALAPDNQGGFWAAVKNRINSVGGVGGGLGGQVFFYHYTQEPPADVFEEAPQPFAGRQVRMTGLAGSADGTIWAATDSSLLARYDRLTGWQLTRIPGWDPGRIVTRSSEVNALAVNEAGIGVAVGRQGRIANLSPNGVRLDEAASILCDGAGIGPSCGTTRDLRAVSVAPGGSALAGGDAMATLWKPPDGPFERIPSPPGGSATNITGISMPSPARAWITTDTGVVFRGEMAAPGEWSWRQENKVGGTTLGAISKDFNLPLRAVAIDGSGHGYAVGDKGLLLERTGEEGAPWRRLRGPGTDALTSVSLARDTGQALIGGVSGVVWTASGGEVEVARPADFFDSGAGQGGGQGSDPWTGQVVGTAILPGIEDGETEAWVAIRSQGGVGTNRLLHYSSDPAEPLTDPVSRAAPVPDSPAERPGELAFAAFGKSECDYTDEICPEMIGTGDRSETIARGIADELATGGSPSVDPQFALFTGDASDSAGLAGASALDLEETGNPNLVGPAATANGAFRHRRYAEFVADPLAEAGIPFLGAPGAGDLARPYACLTTATGFSVTDRCHDASGEARAGENLAFREGFADQASPFGSAETALEGGLGLEPASGQDEQAQEVPDVNADPDGDGEIVQPIATGSGARTHYAADVLRDGEPVARLVALDSSHRGLAATDATQDPVEPDGQTGWLERMLCFEGQSVSGGECTRQRDQAAIVLSNTPTYSYGPVDPTSLATDGSVLESLYLRYRVSVVVSGRLGWNGLYYALRPGLHTPCAGDPYPERPPQPGTGLCESVAANLPRAPAGGDPNKAVEEVEEAAGADVSQITAATGGGDGLVPFVVASGAGGKFGPRGENQSDSAADGFWHGYSVVRVPEDGDPRGVIVEQRPLLDWVAIEGADHTVRPRQRLRLDGIGREPIAFSWDIGLATTRYDEISTQAITHRFDLLLADPEEPWIPCRADDPGCLKLRAGLAKDEQVGTDSACAPYLCLPSRVGTIDRTTGEVRAGDGRYPETLALAMLSVGDRAATYPLLFTKTPSFVVKTLARAPGAPPSYTPRTPPPPSQPPLPEVPSIPKIEVPAIPPPPAIPSINAATPPELQPPAPPAPPPPSQQPTPLDLSVAPPGVSISTPTALIQPPTPPVNPAPPGGARKEARQRQAAAQKGGADAGEDARSQGMDLADSPPGPDGAEMTRLDNSFSRLTAAHRGRPEPSFTAYRPAGTDSHLGTGVLYASALTLLAFALATGWRHGRPTPRRRHPELAAPAWSATERRRR